MKVNNTSSRGIRKGIRIYKYPTSESALDFNLRGILNTYVNRILCTVNTQVQNGDSLVVVDDDNDRGDKNHHEIKRKGIISIHFFEQSL